MSQAELDQLHGRIAEQRARLGPPVYIAQPPHKAFIRPALVWLLGPALTWLRGGVRRHAWLIEISTAALAILAFGLSFQANELARGGNELSRLALADQRTSAAWQILANHAGGSTGKQYALGVLLEPIDARLAGIDLSCELKAGHSGAQGIVPCEEGVDLDRLAVDAVDPSVVEKTGRVPERALANSSLRGASMLGVEINDVDFNDVDMSDTVLGGVYRRVAFMRVDFSRSWLLFPSFDGVVFGDVDFSDSNLEEVSLSDGIAWTGDINISGAVFCHGPFCNDDVSPDFWRRAWFWEDEPPAVSADAWKQLRPGCELDLEMRQFDRIAPPSNCGVDYVPTDGPDYDPTNYLPCMWCRQVTVPEQPYYE